MYLCTFLNKESFLIKFVLIVFSEFKEDEHLDFNPREHLRFDVLSVYPRQIRKRTQSESEKVRLEDSSRYKTG